MILRSVASYHSLLLDEIAREFIAQGQGHSRLMEILIVDMTFGNVNYQIIWQVMAT